MRGSSALRYAEFCGDAAFSRYCRAGQVRLLAINETESVGPAMARYFASKLWQGEAHFMQIDAHTWFADGWDAQLVAMLRRAPSDKPVLSTYPPAPVREAATQIRRDHSRRALRARCRRRRRQPLRP